MESTPYSASYPERLHEVASRVKEAKSEVEQQVRTFYERVRSFGSDVDSQVRGRPYFAVGAAAGVGFGVGAFFGSAIVRTLLLSVGGYAVSELLRKQVAKWLDELSQETDLSSPNVAASHHDPNVS